jgi:hypothetical protein
MRTDVCIRCYLSKESSLRREEEEEEEEEEEGKPRGCELGLLWA